MKEALELRAMLLGSATIPTPGEAEKMRKLTGKLTMRSDPGIAQPAPRTNLSPASLTVRAPLPSLLTRCPVARLLPDAGRRTSWPSRAC